MHCKSISQVQFWAESYFTGRAYREVLIQVWLQSNKK